MLILSLSKNVDFHHPSQDQNVDNRIGTATIMPESAWAPQTAVRVHIFHHIHNTDVLT